MIEAGAGSARIDAHLETVTCTGWHDRMSAAELVRLSVIGHMAESAQRNYRNPTSLSLAGRPAKARTVDKQAAQLYRHPFLHGPMFAAPCSGTATALPLERWQYLSRDASPCQGCVVA